MLTSMYIIMYNDVYIVIMHNNLLFQIMNDIFLEMSPIIKIIIL